MISNFDPDEVIRTQKQEIAALRAHIRELEAALKEAHAELGLGEQTDIQTRLHERIRELEAALATTNELLATAKISSSEAALRWAFDGRMYCLSYEQYIQRGLKAVCWEGEK